MLVSRVTQQEIEHAARVAGVGLLNLHAVNGRKFAFRFRLVPIASKWQRYSGSYMRKRDGSRRRVHAVCWHGHRAFMRALYAQALTARIVTAFATYTDAEQFERTHGATYGERAGSLAAPIAFGDLCPCSEGI